MRPSRFLGTAALFGVLSLVTGARASVVDIAAWTPLFQGIDQTSATIDGSHAYAVRIDLGAPGIGFTTTPASGPLETVSQTTSQFLQTSGTQVAINADFFDPCCHAYAEPKNLEGLAISNGALVSPDQVGRPALLLTAVNEARIVASATGQPLDLTGVYNAVSGSDILVAHGANVAPTASTGFNNANPRSVVGLSADAGLLYLVAIEGRLADSPGTSLVETADLMLGLGADQALNLDGGGSTALVVADHGTPRDLNRPSGGTERYDGNNLGVFARALPVPEPATLPLFVLAALGVHLAARRARR
jgi:hypothetical protein